MKREITPNRLGRIFLRWAWVACLLAGLALLSFPRPARPIAAAPNLPGATRGISQVSLPADPAVSASPDGVRLGYRNIENIRVGQRVFAHNPQISDDERDSWGEPDWNEWRHLELEMVQASAAILRIKMIRPIEWLELNEATPGSTISLDLAEMGASGTACVVSVGAAPPVAPGPGQVVTATFSHPPSTQVLDVTIGPELAAAQISGSASHLEGETETIGVTDNHLFWSVDQEEFLPIGEMALGERLLTYHGDTKRVLAKLPRPGPQTVYNLEVYGEHVYFVGRLGILVHNSYTGDVLMVGEGNLSYARALVEAGEINPNRLVATVFESDFVDDLARSNAAWLKGRGARVMTGVDGRSLASTFPDSFDNIIFHFPHTGSTTNSNIAMLDGFFASSSARLKTNGQVHVTLSQSPHYNRWSLGRRASAGELVPTGRRSFSANDYPGYRHMQTNNPAASATEQGFIYSFGRR